MFDTIAGLPLHPLVVHATEVIVPAAAVTVLLAVLWPRFRRWARFVPLGLSVIALVLVPISTESGESLEHRVGENNLIETHSNLAEGLLPWVIGLVVVAAALLVWNWNDRKEGSTPRDPRWVPAVLAVAGVLVAGGTTVQAIRVGHSGATAVWQEDMKSQPTGGDEG